MNIAVQQIPIQVVLMNVCEELFALSQRLQRVEEIIFDTKVGKDVSRNIEGMQDMDLIIQQISDMARALNCLADVELGDVAIGSDALDGQLHLADLRKRLLESAEYRLLDKDRASQDVLLF